MVEYWIEDLVHKNQVSATQGQRILNRCVDAGISELNSKKRKGSFKNAARAWRRARQNANFSPEPYEFKAPVWNAKKKQLVMEDVSIWLPLDLIQASKCFIRVK